MSAHQAHGCRGRARAGRVGHSEDSPFFLPDRQVSDQVVAIPAYALTRATELHRRQPGVANSGVDIDRPTDRVVCVGRGKRRGPGSRRLPLRSRTIVRHWAALSRVEIAAASPSRGLAQGSWCATSVGYRSATVGHLDSSRATKCCLFALRLPESSSRGAMMQA
jgi:hypothetical protein